MSANTKYMQLFTIMSSNSNNKSIVSVYTKVKHVIKIRGVIDLF